MADLPGRSAYQPEDRADRPEEGTDTGDGGWGSPVPAEYGSLRAVRPADQPDPGRGPFRSDPSGREGSASLAGGLFSAWSRPAGRRGADPVADQRPDPAPAAASGPPGPADRQGGADGQGGAGPSTPRPLRPFREPEAVRPLDTMGGGLASERDIAGDVPTGVVAAVGSDRPSSAGIWAPAGPADPDATSAFPVTSTGEAAVPAVAASSEAARPTMGRPGAPLRPARRPGRIRSRVVLRHLDVSTVAKVSVIFYLLVLIIIVVASVLLWAAADSFGTLPSIQKSVRTLFSLRSFRLHVGAVAMYTAAAGVVIAVVGTIANILLAMIYNLIADVVGGIRVELESFGRD